MERISDEAEALQARAELMVARYRLYRELVRERTVWLVSTFFMANAFLMLAPRLSMPIFEPMGLAVLALCFVYGVVALGVPTLKKLEQDRRDTKLISDAAHGHSEDDDDAEAAPRDVILAHDVMIDGIKERRRDELAGLTTLRRWCIGGVIATSVFVYVAIFYLSAVVLVLALTSFSLVSALSLALIFVIAPLEELSYFTEWRRMGRLKRERKFVMEGVAQAGALTPAEDVNIERGKLSLSTQVGALEMTEDVR